RLSLPEATGEAARGLARKFPDEWGPLAERALEFLRGRLGAHFLAEGYRPDLVEAALAVASQDVVGIKKRLDALAALARTPEFDDFALTFKRVSNIVAKFWEFLSERRPELRTIYTGEPPEGRRVAVVVMDVKEDLLKEKEEKALYADLQATSAVIGEMIEKENFAGALGQLPRLKPRVDAFFDAVLVDDPGDEARKENRLKLLWKIAQPVFQIADFRKVKFEREMPLERAGVEGG
ncbi:MAG: DALR anticodon-binding domain-containing protein, partial [Nitrospinota bacterium]